MPSTAALTQLDDAIERSRAVDERAVNGVVGAPKPRGRLRRVPQI